MALNFRKADRLRKFFNGCEITMETFERELCVCGCHVYQRIWTAAVGEVLHCEREPTNSRDRYAVAVKNICALNFRKPGHLRKYCNNENFPIYGIPYAKKIILMVSSMAFAHVALILLECSSCYGSNRVW